jgi:hypothetical protein
MQAKKMVTQTHLRLEETELNSGPFSGHVYTVKPVLNGPFIKRNSVLN